MAFQNIVIFFETLIQSEKALENTRITLTSKIAFEPYSAFKEIDKEMTGFITGINIQKYLEKHGYFFELSHILRFVKHYSTHSNGKLFVGDFMKFVLPLTKISLREDALRRRPGIITNDVESLFLCLFKIELEMWENIEKISSGLYRIPGFSVEKIFAEIDLPRGGFLDQRKILNFLARFHVFLTDEEANNVVHRLDLDKDGLISLEEFDFILSGCEENLQQKSAFKSTESPQKIKKKNSRQASEIIKSSTNDPAAVLINMIKNILQLEEKIDKEKKKLIICPDFNMQEIFCVFDENNLNFSTESDFLTGLKHFGVKAAKDEVTLIFKHYSSETYKKRLNYTEISRLFLPYLEENTVFSKCELHPNTLKKIKFLLETHIQHEKVFEKYRQLWKKNSLCSEDIFRVFGNEKVSEKEIQFISREFYKELNDKELFWILTFFKHKNGFFTFPDFQSEFSAKSLKRY